MWNLITPATALMASLIVVAPIAAETVTTSFGRPTISPESPVTAAQADVPSQSKRRAFGLDGPTARPALPTADPPPPAIAPRPPTRAETIDKLLGRLARSDDADESKGIMGRVESLWMESGSDTADLLMRRAVSAMNGSRHDVAAALLDQIIDLQPDWAEAWNKRATLRFLENDDPGSMEDISHVLALEPRHFGALSGMGFILERHGENRAALKVLRRALVVYPQNTEIRGAVDKLVPVVEGRDL